MLRTVGNETGLWRPARWWAGRSWLKLVNLPKGWSPGDFLIKPLHKLPIPFLPPQCRRPRQVQGGVAGL